MMMLLLMAGIGALLGGVVAIAYGIPVKEFSFGNTMITVGAMAACTGLIMIALSLVIGELKLIARRLASVGPAESRARAALGSAGSDAAADDEFEFPRDPSSARADEEDFEPVPPPLTAPTRNGIGASRARKDVPPAPEPAEPAPQAGPKPRRNLMFASTSRRDRERAQGRPPDVPVSAPPLPPSDEPSGSTSNFDEPWPKPERLRLPELPSQRRGGRMPPAFNEPNAGPAARNSDQQTVTVLKSGVVDGMAYSLYSDGSIEAQLPEGTMRFGSIDELRVHLDQRPG
jgi:hypothetical protein